MSLNFPYGIFRMFCINVYVEWKYDPMRACLCVKTVVGLLCLTDVVWNVMTRCGASWTVRQYIMMSRINLSK